ncbi:DUF3967 domain-containing protein [Bacillus sp. RG28]|uniref:DUF3967 domain-containing protein n=1 Tax=Gottfriedia endophytica TaxID=2820819 RepID=A0A940NNK9_9BACI|nr:DUF3967 domain-containing protein [Gottfriedia endophytica]MBP0724718.1 DUF3967 domain-containing protein [Gottfriedia endophytica]
MKSKYTMSDVSNRLKVSKSDVRRISQELEKQGYSILKNGNTRKFNELEIHSIELIYKEYKLSNNLYNAVKMYLSTINSSPTINETGQNNIDSFTSQYLENNHNNYQHNESTQIEKKDDIIEVAFNPDSNQSKETTQRQFDQIAQSNDIDSIELINNKSSDSKIIVLNEHHSSASSMNDNDQELFQEFMTKITGLTEQNEQILIQNNTLIQQNIEKDQKLEKILHSVEEKSEELQQLVTVIEEKDEKLEELFEELEEREITRDAQVMRMIRELQETKKMIAATEKKSWKQSIKSLFVKQKNNPEKQNRFV